MHSIETFYCYVDDYNILSNTLHAIFYVKIALDFEIFMLANFGYVLSVNNSFKLILFLFPQLQRTYDIPKND